MADARIDTSIPDLASYKEQKNLIAELDLLDADGCLYNPIYACALKALVAEHWAFFYKYPQRDTTQEALQAYAAIKAGILAGKYDTPDMSDVIVNLIKAGKIVKNWQLQSEVKAQGQLSPETLAEITNTVNKLPAKTLISDLMNFCIDNMYRWDGELLGELVVKYNAALINDIAKRATQTQLLFLAVGSQRQSKDSNDYSRKLNNNGCIYRDLLYFTQHLRQRMPNHTVIMLKMVLADIHNQLNFGTCFKTVLEDLECKNPDCHVEHAYDETKFSIIYPFIQLLKMNLPHAKINTYFYDDRIDVHAKLLEVYSQYPIFQAENDTLSFCEFSGDAIKLHGCVVGTGVVDVEFYENSRAILKEYRQKCAADPKLPRCVASSVDLNQFAKRRLLQMSKVADHLNSFYTSFNEVNIRFDANRPRPTGRRRATF